MPIRAPTCAPARTWRLVLALQGKFGEAQTVASRDLSPAEAAQNIASIREMVSQTNNWQKLKTARKLPPQG